MYLKRFVYLLISLMLLSALVIRDLHITKWDIAVSYNHSYDFSFLSFHLDESMENSIGVEFTSQNENDTESEEEDNNETETEDDIFYNEIFYENWISLELQFSFAFYNRPLLNLYYHKLTPPPQVI